jgi:glucokinase
LTTEIGVPVGVDVGGTKVLAMALGPDGYEPIGECRVPTPDGADALVEVIAASALDAAKDAGAPLGAVAVGVPGLVDAEGVMRFAANLPGVVELELRRLLTKRLGVPTTVDNDANVAAWGERVAGAGARDGKPADDMLMVTLGTGIGGGIVLDGALYRGAHGMAGEIGHFVVQLEGEPCQCGQRGCWERYASGSALGRIARAAGFADGEDVVAKAIAHDEKALAVFHEFVHWIAIGLAGLANILDPAVIVVGGGLVETGGLLLDPLRVETAALIEGGPHRPAVPILPATLGERAGAIGAALIARGP